MNIPKFRAWHKSYKQMLPVISMSWDAGCVNFGLEFQSGEWLCSEPQIELMQSSRLSDINHKDIYDGDIVRWEISLGGNCEPEYRHAVVTQAIQRWVLEVINEQGSDCFGILDPINLEIIGNIYENVELLK